MRLSLSTQSCLCLFKLFSLSLILSLGFFPVDAAPARIKTYETTLVRRQDNQPLSQPTTVTTVTQVNTANGPVTETCQITLTPINVNGQQEVQEVKQCTVSLDTGSGLSSGGSEPTSTPAITFSSTITTAASNSATSTSDSGNSSASVTTSVGGSPVNGSGPIVNGLSTVPAPTGSPTVTGSTSATASTSAGAQSSSSSGLATSASAGTSASDTAPSTSAVSAVAGAESASGAATATGTSQVAFTLPGKKLSVLPIGLGVFAGISVIALIVVGLVTYERTKYRKAFRQRKLAEQSGAMGYGGMAEPS